MTPAPRPPREHDEPREQQLELRDERGLLLRVLYERVAAVALPPAPASGDRTPLLH